MKRFPGLFLRCALALLVASPVFAQSKGLLQLPEFTALSDKASETVNVTLGPDLLGFAKKFLNADDPEQAAAKKIVDGLTGVYVRHYEFDSDFAYPVADIDRVRRQLAAPGWSRMVEAKSRKENTNVEVYMLIDNGRAAGLAIIANEPREFTIVNIVGSIDLEQLHDLTSLGVPDLGIQSGKKLAEPVKAPTKAPAKPPTGKSAKPPPQ
jgi:hypothetical protein